MSSHPLATMRRIICDFFVIAAYLGNSPKRRLHEGLAVDEDVADAVRFGGDDLVLESHSTAQPSAVPSREGHLRARYQPGVARL